MTTLKQHVIDNPADDLATIKAHSVTSTRMISNSTMRLYFKATSLFLIIHEIAAGDLDTVVDDTIVDGKVVDDTPVSHPAKELCLLITKSLEGSSTDDNDFNFIQGHPFGDGIIADTEEFRDTLLPSHAPYIQALLDTCIAHCNVTTTPFAAIEQEDLDAVKEEIAVEGETVGVVSYDHKDSAQQFHMRNTGNITKIRFELEEAKTYDTTITLYCSERDATDSPFLEFPNPIYTNIVIKAGTLGIPVKLKEFYGRHTQYRAVSNRNDAFTALVTQQSKY